MKLEKSDPSLEVLVSRIRNKELDLQPDFQRGEIWDDKRRQRLIDTILRRWYVPAVHIVVESDEREVVLDGQQRLAAVRDFFNDEFAIDGRIEPSDSVIKSFHGLHYSELPEPTRRAVNRFVLPEIRLSEFGAQEPNELFFRLNQSYNLTPPEKRNALHGPARDQVKGLVDDMEASGLLSREKVGFSNSRLAYDDIVARTCVAVHLGDLRQHINNSVVEDVYRAGPFEEHTISGVREAGDTLLRLIESAGGRVKFNKGTLQTWLIYCFWAPRVVGEIPMDLLGDFEQVRSVLRRGEEPLFTDLERGALEVVRLYDDRASYRVTDVSSVLIRDVAIHCFSEASFGVPGVRDSNLLLARLNHLPERAQGEVATFLADSSWGALPGKGISS